MNGHDAACTCGVCMRAAFAASSDRALRGDMPPAVTVPVRGPR